MKVIKEQLQNNEAKKRGWIFREPMKKESVYDGKVTISVSEREWQTICNGINMSSYSSKEAFVMDCIQAHDTIQELIEPETNSKVQSWFSIVLEQSVKESLERTASKAGMTVEHLIRCLMWSKAKQIFEQKKEQDARRAMQAKKQSYRRINIGLSDEMITKYEQKFGSIKNISEIETKMLELLQKEIG
jgi:16S rRNA U516 pseudouridylate synthase RsuA-like enzyme